MRTRSQLGAAALVRRQLRLRVKVVHRAGAPDDAVSKTCSGRRRMYLSSAGFLFFLIFFSVYEATFVRRLGGGVAGVWHESHYTRSCQASCKLYEE